MFLRIMFLVYEPFMSRNCHIQWKLKITKKKDRHIIDDRKWEFKTQSSLGRKRIGKFFEQESTRECGEVCWDYKKKHKYVTLKEH